MNILPTLVVQFRWSFPGQLWTIWRELETDQVPRIRGRPEKLEGSRNQSYLEREEALAVFKVALKTGDKRTWKAAQVAVREVSGRQRNQKTIKSALRTALELLKPDASGSVVDIDDNAAKDIAQRVGYGITGRAVQRYAEWFQSYRRQQEEMNNPDDGFNNKRRQHEEFLVSGLKTLRRSPLRPDLPTYLDWATGEPAKDIQQDISRNMSFLDIIEVQCLLKHLEPEDPILVAYAKSGEILNEYIQCCSELQKGLVNMGAQASTELGVPLGIRWRTHTGAIIPEFAASLYRIAGALVSNSLDHYEVKFDYYPYGDHKDLIQLFAGGLCIAMVPKSRSNDVEGVYQRLYSGLKQNALIPQLRDQRQQFELQVKELNHAIEIRVQQGRFVPGPCEICSAWGGLLAH
jgi:hypothetical protein